MPRILFRTEGKVATIPKREEIDTVLEDHLIVEYEVTAPAGVLSGASDVIYIDNRIEDLNDLTLDRHA